jgi:predicted nucleic acid-binding protein
VEREDVIFLLGPIIQELLDALSSHQEFERMLDSLSSFPFLKLERHVYVLAARTRNECRGKGVLASPVDFLIAAACITYGCPLLTADSDFARIAEHCDLHLLPAAEGA